MNKITESLEKVTNSTFINIDGYLVEKGIDPETGKEALKWGCHYYKDETAVKKAVEEACRYLSISIVKEGVSERLNSKYVESYHKGQSAYDQYKKDQQQ
jgi:hypothetical protein